MHGDGIGDDYSYCDRPCTSPYIDPGPHVPITTCGIGCDSAPKIFGHACVFPLTGSAACAWKSLFQAPCDCVEFLDGIKHDPPLSDDTVSCDAARCGKNSVWDGCTAVGATGCGFNASVGFCHATAASWQCPEPIQIPVGPPNNVPPPSPVVLTTAAAPVDPLPVVVGQTSQANDGNPQPAPTPIEPPPLGQDGSRIQATSSSDPQPGIPKPSPNSDGQIPVDQSNPSAALIATAVTTTATVSISADQLPAGSLLPGQGTSKSPGAGNIGGDDSSSGSGILNGNSGLNNGAPVMNAGPNKLKSPSGNNASASTTAGSINPATQNLAEPSTGANGLSPGIIGGIIAGTVAVIALVAVGIFILIRRSRQSNEKKSIEFKTEMRTSDFDPALYEQFRREREAQQRPDDSKDRMFDVTYSHAGGAGHDKLFEVYNQTGAGHDKLFEVFGQPNASHDKLFAMSFTGSKIGREQSRMVQPLFHADRRETVLLPSYNTVSASSGADLSQNFQ